VTAKTDKEGGYQFLEVRPGTYVLTVSAKGLRTTSNWLQLLVATRQPRRENAAGKRRDHVEVVTTSQAINTTDATIGNAFGSTILQALPAEGRDPTEFSARSQSSYGRRPGSGQLGSGQRGGAVTARAAIKAI